MWHLSLVVVLLQAQLDSAEDSQMLMTLAVEADYLMKLMLCLCPAGMVPHIAFDALAVHRDL